MTLAVLVVLAALWLGYFVLWFRESRNSASTKPDSVHSFSRALGALARPVADQPRRGGPRGQADGLRPQTRPTRGVFDPPVSAAEATRRRRGLLVVLAATAAVSLMAVPSLGAAALAVHLLADLALLAFVGIVAGRRLRVAPAPVSDSNVRVLHPARPTSEEHGVVVPLRRAADG